MEIMHSLGEFLSGAQVHILYWTLAIAGTVLFAVMFVLTIIGFGGDHDVDGGDGDISGHADTGYLDFKIFSIRSILAFLTFFGWGGVIWGRYAWGGFFASLALGFSMMFITAGILYLMFRMQHSGNVAQEDYKGVRGKVYVGIPGGRATPGKVTVTLAGSTREIQAVADEEIATGSSIVVVEPLDGSKFLVKKI